MDETRPAVTNPPDGPMSERTLRTTLESIDEKCGANGDAIGALQKIENERAGAQKLRARIFTAFGGLVTAAVVGGFVWVWDAQTSNALQDAAIVEIERRGHEHDPAPPGHGELELADHAAARRVDAVDRATKTNGARIDRIEREHGERYERILAELRRLRSRRQTWGGATP